MTPERWQRIDQLYDEALNHKTDERLAFLRQACRGDEELRQEVESLLEAHDRVGNFLSVAQEKPEALVGQQLGSYQILSLLGAGGMGVVYRVRDTRLNRSVAIKVLPADKVSDPERKRRFIQEARAASALNHPNIITLHDIGSESGNDFIVMEYVAGKTLDRRIPRKGMRLNEGLKLATQMADALAKAHSAGIIHRDLKPTNVMVTDDGVVKVLDFGLAKLTELVTTEGTPRTQLSETEEGMIVGTLSYMSPEQAEGKKVDTRSDIFSFGAVLYEMVSGQKAFQGDSKLSTLTAVLKQEPKPISQLVADVPPDLEKIIARCLRKDPSRRFQHMEDLKVALEELKGEQNLNLPSAVEAEASLRKPGRLSVVKWAAVGLVAIGLGLAAWFWLGRSAILQRDAALIPVPLTAYPGWESSPSFSPEGNQVVFEWSKSSRFEDADIYIKQIGVEGNPAQLTDHPGSDQTPVWSPDGRTIAFARILPPDWRRIAYIVKPQRGGSERTVAEFDTPGPIDPNFEFYKPVKWCTWSADSRGLVVVGKSDAVASTALFWVSIETREVRQLTDPPPELADFSPAVSPDGRTLAFNRGNNFNRADLYLLALSEGLKPQGTLERLEFDIRLNLFPTWTSDARELVFVSANTNANMSLWKIAVSDSAQRQRLAFPAAWNLAVSRQGNRLAYSTWEVDTNIWRVEISSSGRKPGKPAKVFSSTFVETEPAYSPDGGQIALTSGRSGSWEIWVVNSDGSNPEKLTSFEGPMASRPRWSPNGQRILFYSDASGNRDVYVMRKDGSELKRLTADPASDTNPGWSADGKWIYFSSERSKQHRVWKVPVGGGEAVPVQRVKGGEAVESPDGKFLYYGKGGGVWRVPTSGGSETQVIDSLHPQGGWVAVNEGVYFISKPDEKGVSYIRFKDVASGSARTIAPIEHPVLWGFTVSPDRRSFLYSQADNYGSDLMLVENFR